MTGYIKGAFFALTAMALAGANAFGATASLTFGSSGLNGNYDCLTSGCTSNPVSPYTGTLSALSGTAGNAANGGVVLYCDDYHDSWSLSNSAVTGEVLTGLTSGSLSSSNTRFGGLATADVDYSSYGVTSTSLYDQLAWLFTQLGYEAAKTQTTSVEKIEATIQEAAWDITDPLNDAGVDNYQTDAQAWINLARGDYNQTLSGAGLTATVGDLGSVTLENANYSAWFIIDATANLGQSGEATGNQEFLAYDGTINAGPPTKTPEPATLGLMGLALLGGGLFRRRKTTR